ncbi:MAG: response regulator transcription factor [Ignavibacteriae bacterium]|nr:response regulator transcription factor [Ignavibacteriota bacterium]MCB9208506.1 response regulator transcription factor [Ignavibacteriales bacterium]MCB9258385.1 response regulator transcription factor [Ignavibacteriales bacterium]
MKILIIEDEPGIAKFIKQGLEEELYQIEISSDGISGLENAKNNYYDLILLDWMLPGITGLEVLTQLRKTNKEIPVIFLTAKDTVQDTVLGLKAGANDYIKKPFAFEELLERIKVQLRPKTSEDDKLIWGDIIIDRRAYQVFKNDKEIILTQKEFSLLEFLILNKGKVCTRTQIIQKVWDINFEYNTGVIDVFINALRNKLDLKESDNYIKTIRGIGYTARERE